MKVLKFGGTSVGTTSSLNNVKAIVESLSEPGIVVVSALGGLTDKLISTARMAASGDSEYEVEMDSIRLRHFNIIKDVVPCEKSEDVVNKVADLLDELGDLYKGLSLIKDLPTKTLDAIVSYGERMSSIIVAAMLKDAIHLNSLDIIKTEKWFNKNIADRNLTDKNIKDSVCLPLNKTIVMGGFISRDGTNGEVTNLGRGGSDYTAALVAAALNAECLEIWTDVDGFMTADPRIIPDAKVIKNMSFVESMELCSFGAKVIYPPTIYPVFHKNIPIKILNTHNPEAPGTLITDCKCDRGRGVKGISPLRNISVIKLNGDIVANVAQINTRTYNAMARNGISIYLASQTDGETSFAFSVVGADSEKAKSILETEYAPELQSGDLKSIEIIDNLSIIAIVGEGINEMPGLEARLLYTLKRHDIEVVAVSEGASETTVTVVVPDYETNRALLLIHQVLL